jgi:HD superfamily phosphohydrolase
MYTQVYLHHVRLIYDVHLIDFLKSCLSGRSPRLAYLGSISRGEGVDEWYG